MGFLVKQPPVPRLSKKPALSSVPVTELGEEFTWKREREELCDPYAEL